MKPQYLVPSNLVVIARPFEQKEENLVKKSLLLIFGLVALSVSSVNAQEVVVTGFPLGVGASVDPELFVPYRAQLQELADSLSLYPRARAVLVGRADGIRFRLGNDGKNPAVSLGRAHALRNILVNDYLVDSTQIWIQSSETFAKGDEYRSVSVRIEYPPVEPDPFPAPIAYVTPEVQPTGTAVDVYHDQMTLRLSGGVTSTPFGSLPTVAGAVSWNHTVSIEVIMGHTFWNDEFILTDPVLQPQRLDTWRRMVGGRLNIYPWESQPVGFVFGWARIEEIAKSQYEFVKLSEGPVFGMTVIPFPNVSLMAAFNPARHRIAPSDKSFGKDGQILVSISMFTDFGGSR